MCLMLRVTWSHAWVSQASSILNVEAQHPEDPILEVLRPVPGDVLLDRVHSAPAGTPGASCVVSRRHQTGAWGVLSPVVQLTHLPDCSAINASSVCSQLRLLVDSAVNSYSSASPCLPCLVVGPAPPTPALLCDPLRLSLPSLCNHTLHDFNPFKCMKAHFMISHMVCSREHFILLEKNVHPAIAGSCFMGVL